MRLSVRSGISFRMRYEGATSVSTVRRYGRFRCLVGLVATLQGCTVLLTQAPVSTAVERGSPLNWSAPQDRLSKLDNAQLLLDWQVMQSILRNQPRYWPVVMPEAHLGRK